MNELARILADDGGAEQALVVAAEDELHESLGLTEDLGARVRTEARLASLARQVLCAGVVFRQADRGDLGNCPDAEGLEARDGLLVLELERVADRHARLLHGRGREPRKADDVAGGVDVRDAGAELVVHLDEAVRVGGDAGMCEAELGRVALAPGAVEHAFRKVCRAVAQRDVAQSFVHLDGGDVEAEVRLDAKLARELLAQRVADVVVEVREQAFLLLDDGDLHAEGAEGAGELAAHDAAADDDHAGGNGLQ